MRPERRISTHPSSTTRRTTVTASVTHPRQQVSERLLTPGEVATLFRVDPKTVTRWATAGRIGSIRTPGGHRRFRESEVKTLLAELTTEASEPVRGM
jgi:excisionase family DNA binding protein